MQKKSIARGNATRTANKNRRRDHILECASNLIASRGIDAFTLGELATMADVTVPTIHNLLGRKAQIVEHLVNQMISRTSEALSEPSAQDPIEAIEIFVDRLINLFAANEDLYKAAFVAGEKAKLFEHQMVDGIYKRSLDIAESLCEGAVQRHYLNGDIESKTLARQLFAAQRLARQDWVHGYIDLIDYKKQVLLGMFITLTADANPSFKQRLVEKIKRQG